MHGGDRQDQHRHGLMQQRKRQRHAPQQRRDAERHLQRDSGEQRDRPQPRRSFPHRAHDIERMQKRGDKDRVSEHAVIELHRQNILEEIAPERRLEKEPRPVGYQRAVDERPGIVRITRAQARNQRTEIDLRQKKYEQPRRAAPDASRHWHNGAIGHPPCRPDQRDIDRAGQEEMCRQPILRDLDAIGEARRDHPPADDALQRTESENEPKPRAQIPRHPPAPEEPQEGQQISGADHAPKQPMRPFPPINRLELGKAHAAVEFAILRNCPIFFERRLPRVFGQRRHHTHQRLPLGDRKAGFGEPRRAADQHHRQHQSGNGIKPQPDRACVGNVDG